MKKEPWHDSFLESLAELADIDRQRSTWVGGEANDLPNSSELVCQVFDDSGLDDLLRSGTVFSEPVDELLRELSNSVETFDLGKPAAELVADEEWIAIADPRKTRSKRFDRFWITEMRLRADRVFSEFLLGLRT